MKYLIRSVIIIFIFSLVLTQAHSILRYFDESLARTKINMFLDRSYKREITVQWYVYFLGLYFFLICCMFIGVMGFMRVSFKLTMIFFIGAVYWYIKLILVLYNYDSSDSFDWFLVGVVILSLIILVIPERKSGKYKSMQ